MDNATKLYPGTILNTLAYSNHMQVDNIRRNIEH